MGRSKGVEVVGMMVGSENSEGEGSCERGRQALRRGGWGVGDSGKREW